MIKNFETFINEKFDYTKQEKNDKYESLFNIKKGENVYISYIDIYNKHKIIPSKIKNVESTESIEKRKTEKTGYNLIYNDKTRTKFSFLYAKDSNLDYPIFPGLYYDYSNIMTYSLDSVSYCLVSTNEKLLYDFENSHDMKEFLFKNDMKTDIKLVDEFLGK